MDGKIRLLSDEVIGKIAAGEVVERPSAAIKEMVENSLDAGATAVTVEIRDGGISYLRVTDNGSGIPQSEIRMAFERHATSKIVSAQDLSAIHTLGFRGEALASIAAVAKVTCTTRTKRDASGIRVVNQGGRIESIEEAACPEGTSFVVRDLFFNTPVRLKFLKKPATEAGYVSDLMMRLILSRPDVSFRFISQGKTLYHSAGDGKLASAVFSIYGKEVRAMQEVEGHQAGMVLRGYVGAGDCARATRAHQSFFINGRYMKSSVLSAAVEAACREQLAPGRYPTCVLHLTMPYDLVDVNVHPNKLECRFQNDSAIAEAVEAIVRDAYADKSPLDAPPVMQLSPSAPASATPVVVKKQEAPASAAKAPVMPERTADTAQEPVQAATQRAPELPVASTKAAEKPPVPVGRNVPAQDRPLPQMKPLQPLNRPGSPVLHEPLAAVQTLAASYQQAKAMLPAMAEPTAPPTPERKAASFLPDMPKPLRMIGTAFNSYILVEYDDTLLLIDQQGVHERLLFDRMMKALDTHSCSQELLLPLIVPATRREQMLLESHRALLESIGLTVEAFGENEVAIRAIPMILGQPQAGDLLREILDQLEGERGVISLEKRRAGILALACKRAVRSGDQLDESALRELVVRMVEKKIIPTSPRGTPLIVALTHLDIDRRFRRPS
ncbi:MAG: DNA mismatch repair endonuclease MutL [Clostridiales bacterium]|nr:DNA mismatch repair endonuclease MutL [Clostridiales bacterium]